MEFNIQKRNRFNTRKNVMMLAASGSLFGTKHRSSLPFILILQIKMMSLNLVDCSRNQPLSEE